MDTNTYNANVLVKDLPRHTDNILSALAALRNINKWEIVRQALVEYANNHRAELASVGAPE